MQKQLNTVLSTVLALRGVNALPVAEAFRMNATMDGSQNPIIHRQCSLERVTFPGTCFTVETKRPGNTGAPMGSLKTNHSVNFRGESDWS